MSLELGEEKKRKKKDRGKKKNKPPADFKLVERVLLVFLDATGRGGLGFAFLPSYGFERVRTRSGTQYSQLPSLWPRSSVSCQIQISQSLGAQLESNLVGRFHLATQSLGTCSLNHPWAS